MNTSITFPNQLKTGDTIGLITPGSAISQEQLENTIKSLNLLGFKSFFYPSVLERKGFLAGTDLSRANEINSMFSNSNIDGVLCVRGGYGCARIIPLLNFEIIRQSKKPLIGYSDVTALLSATYNLAHTVSFHAPMGVSDFTDYTTKSFLNAITSKSDNYLIHPFTNEETETKNEYQSYLLNEGKAEGILAGGNLAVVCSLAGTEYGIDFDGKIAFLEDIDEAPYRIDRMLTQLLQASNLAKAKAIILGVFVNCDIDGSKYNSFNSLTLKQVFEMNLSSLNIPVMYGYSFGHIDNMATIPFGAMASFNTKTLIIEINST